MNPTCETCRYLSGFSCTRFPVWTPVEPPTHHCGEFRDLSSTFNHAPEKFSDSDLLDAIRFNGAGFITWKDGVDDLARKFNASRRTIEERVKRLDNLQKLEIARGPNGRRVSVGVHPSIQDWAWWEEHCKKTGEPVLVRWKKLEQEGQLNPGGTRVLRPNTKWTFADHVLPVFVALAPTVETATKYSRVAELVEEATKMNRSAFDRIIKGAVSDGLIVKTETGLYHLK